MLLFEKISCHPRRAEPVTVSIPCGPGRLRPGQRLVIRQDGQDLPLQTRVLARWPDGSAKWLLVDFQPDLPGNAAVSLPFAIVDTASAVAPPVAIVLDQTPEGIAVDTGAIRFLVPRRGFAPVTGVTLRQGSTWSNPCGGFLLSASGRSVSTAEAECTLDLEESGPLRAVIVVRGKHRDAAGGWLDFRGRVTAYAGKPYIEVEHQFIHAEADARIDLSSLALRLTPQTTGASRWALGEGYYRTRIEESGPQAQPLARRIDAESILHQGFEHYVDCFYGDFWADWRDAGGGLAVTIHQAHQNFPKGLVADASGIVCQLYPEGQPPAAIRQGMAKTHRILLHFHGPDGPLDELSIRSLQFQLPDRPALSHDWMLDNDPWGDGLCAAEVGDRMLGDLFARFMDRRTALGMLHFGDAPDAGYSVGHRGGAQTVWINNEYDHAHNCAQFHFQTGERAALDAALVAARHWLDVDLCHYSPDPLQHGGLWAHTADHAPAVGTPGGVSPSHEWVDAFLDYYFLTGRGEGLEAAQSVANNVLRQLERPAMRDIAQLSVRELGWALDTLVAMALGTGEQMWRAAADDLVGRLLRWHDRFGSFLAPYTSHSMPRVPFMIALTGNSLARYTRLQPNPRIDALVVSMTDDLIAHMRGPDGVFVYKEFPSLRRPFAPPQVLLLLTHAWRITGDLRYLQVGVRQLAHALRQPPAARDFVKLADPCGAILLGASSSSGATFAFNYPGLATFAAAARPLGLLAWLEYPEPDPQPLSRFKTVVAGCAHTKGTTPVTSAASSVQPPQPLLPVPTRQQLAWQRDEMLMFVHFGLKTYYVDGDHKGSGTDSPDKFNPERFDARQWVKVARAAGFRGIILTAKHHDGFCNWPTTSTDYSVAATPWKNGRGDVVRELADACREGGLKLGLYLSVWDLHYLSARLDPERYGDYYAEQLTELLVNYGKVDEVWFDGHGADNMTMDWGRNKEIVRRLQPDSVVFDSFVFGNRENFCLRWPGNEEGCAPEPNWSVFPSPDSSAPGPRIWYPCEADTIMQGCWFWNDKPPCSLNRLKDIYFSSVGRNAVLLLNVAPDPSGRICDAAVERLSEFRAWLDRVFARNLAAGAKVVASQVRGGAGIFAADNVLDSDPDTYWATDDGTAEATLELELSAPAEFSVALIQEPVARGQRVAAHRLEIQRDNAWHKIAEGTTIGHKRLHRFDTVKAQRIRLVLAKSLAAPAISAFGLYHDR